MNKIYSRKHGDEIPWNISAPPELLVELIDKKIVVPCRAIDLGCGAGNYSIYLTQKGFDVTGIDISTEAIKLAKENANRAGVKCEFLSADLTSSIGGIDTGFDFAFEWELLHHIYPEQRNTYFSYVKQLLNRDAKYLSVHFSEDDEWLGAGNKYRVTPINTKLYFSSEDEMEKIYSKFFKIIELKTVKISGKKVTHKAIYCLMENSKNN